MHSLHLPAVLGGIGRESGISMERALNQIKDLLESMEPKTGAQEDKIEASIGDVEMMLRRIRR